MTSFNAKTRAERFDAIVDFAKGSPVDTGFGYLDGDGNVDTSRPVELWITCRMTHVFSLASLKGDGEAAKLAAHGVQALSTSFHDEEFGGWFSAIGHDAENVEIVDGTKAAYAHAFVVLAASSATVAGIEGAKELLDQALAAQDEIWWEEGHAKVRESFNREFTETEDYRGVNANMHTVEAYLAAFDATSDRKWLDRALAILDWVLNEQAAGNNWRIPEHYSADWEPIADYNIDKPQDPFRPYGYTPGHGLEWARLALHAGAELERVGEEAPEWIREDAKQLVKRAVEDGWNVGGRPGFVYTVDEEGVPVARERMHWVLCEAIGAVVTLLKVLKDDPREDEKDFVKWLKPLTQEFWDFAQRYFIDVIGNWIHELDPFNLPSTNTWPGKPDAYHVAQMLLLPDLPLAPTFALALKQAEKRGAVKG
ncbi:MAG: AGE family epimerase/isomerase [Actinomycetaceae bacterium]|nr:AGE family epimerase/isomerase [Actinomycetaceae bacterium]